VALIWERRNGALIILFPALIRPLWVDTVEEVRTAKITTEHKLVLELANTAGPMQTPRRHQAIRDESACQQDHDLNAEK
jgi:hypothetical protein